MQASLVELVLHAGTSGLGGLSFFEKLLHTVLLRHVVVELLPGFDVEQFLGVPLDDLVEGGALKQEPQIRVLFEEAEVENRSHGEVRDGSTHGSQPTVVALVVVGRQRDLVADVRGLHQVTNGFKHPCAVTVLHSDALLEHLVQSTVPGHHILDVPIEFQNVISYSRM